MFFIYKLLNTANGRYYFGTHKSEDPYWANPPCYLHELRTDHAGAINKALTFPRPIRVDIKTFGKDKFLVEALRGAATEQEAEFFFNRVCDDKVREDPMSYNRKKGRPKKNPQVL